MVSSDAPSGFGIRPGEYDPVEACGTASFDAFGGHVVVGEMGRRSLRGDEVRGELEVGRRMMIPKNQTIYTRTKKKKRHLSITAHGGGDIGKFIHCICTKY